MPVRRVILDDNIGGWDTVIEEPRWFSWAYVAGLYAGKGLRWAAVRIIPAAVLLAGVLWLVIQAIWFAALGVLVFALIPVGVFAFRAVRITYDEIGGL
jgi:hypothetical protein